MAVTFSQDVAARICAEIAIYGLRDPRGGGIRYIGKAKDVAKRLKSHLRDATRRNTPVYTWIRGLLAEGILPQAETITWASPEAWPHVERLCIKAFSDGSDGLLNVAAGGNEPFCALDVRRENGRRVVSLRASTPERKRLWELKRNMGDHLKRGFVSEATKAKMRAAALRRPDLFSEWATI